MNWLYDPSSREDGASAVEYGLLVAAVAAVIIAIVFAVGLATNAMFKETCDSIDTNGSATITAAADC